LVVAWTQQRACPRTDLVSGASDDNLVVLIESFMGIWKSARQPRSCHVHYLKR
jgi:hypothetical protein